jgi:hypothetical protein
MTLVSKDTKFYNSVKRAKATKPSHDEAKKMLVPDSSIKFTK